MNKILYAPQIIENAQTKSILPGRIVVNKNGVIDSLEYFETTTQMLENYNKTNTLKLSDQEVKLYSHQLITPAFINAHTHCAMSFFRSIPTFKKTKANMIEDIFFHLEKHLLPDDVEIFTLFGALENIQNGVGLVWDHYYHPIAMANAFKQAKLMAVMAPTLQDLFGPGVQNCQKFLEQLQNLKEDPLIYKALGPHATDTVSVELWKQIIDISIKDNMPIHFHLAQTYKEFSRIKELHQMTPMELLIQKTRIKESPQLVGVHGTYLSQGDLKLMATLKNMAMVQCPQSASVFAFPAHSLNWSKYKIPYALGTDCVASNDSMNIQKEMRAWSAMHLSSVSYSKKYKTFFQDATLENAHDLEKYKTKIWSHYKKDSAPATLLSRVWDIPGHFHPHFKCGKIEKGYQANFAFWDTRDASFWPQVNLKTLTYGDTIGALTGLMIGGNVVLSEKMPASVIREGKEYKEYQKIGNARLQSLLKRARINI